MIRRRRLGFPATGCRGLAGDCIREPGQRSLALRWPDAELPGNNVELLEGFQAGTFLELDPGQLQGLVVALALEVDRDQEIAQVVARTIREGPEATFGPLQRLVCPPGLGEDFGNAEVAIGR